MPSVSRIIFLMTASMALISSASADSESYSVQYGDSVDMETPFSTFRDGNKFVGCNDQKFFSGSPGDVEIPSDLPCSLGTHEIEVYHDSHGVTSGYTYQYSHDLTVTSGKKASNVNYPGDKVNKGRYVVLRLRGNNDKLEDFFLTNEPWNDEGRLGFNEFPEHDTGRPLPKGALFLASEADGNVFDKSDEGVWVADFGEVEEFGKSLWDHMAFPYDTGDGSAGWFAGGGVNSGNGKKHVRNTLKTEFSSLTEGPKFDQKCSLASNNYKWNGNCAPLHSNGEYTPQGEIIVATEPSKSSFYDNENPHPSTYFYVCRGDYTGSSITDSKVVKVQESSQPLRGGTVYYDEWNYYRCNQNNDWIEVECPPGQLMKWTGTELRCKDKSPVNVDAKFFNLENVSSTLASSGQSIVTGFKIEESEINEYEDVMGRPLARIDAECWMGNEKTRPPESETGTFRLDYTSGDAWVLGEIPYRPSVSNLTYSCLWGFSEKKTTFSPTDYGIYESTRTDPLMSRDSGRVDVSYQNKIVPEYIDLNKYNRIDETVTRFNLWTPYKSGADTRGHVPNDDYLNMFAEPFGEFPYCTVYDVYDRSRNTRFPVPVSDVDGILDHVKCS